MQWSVAEQTIPAAVFAGDEHPHLMAINLRVDPNRAHLVVMELQVEGGGGYALLFDRNGAMVAHEEIKPPAPPEGETHSVSHHASSGKKR
jgi:hypothetical protein